MGYAAANIVDFVRGFGQRKEASQVKNEMKNYLADPEATIQKVNQINPEIAIPLHENRMQQQRKIAAEDRTIETADQTKYLTGVRNVAQMLGRARDNPDTDLGQVFDQLMPVFKNGFGLPDEEILDLRAKIIQDPSIIDVLGEDADRKLMNVAAGGVVFDPVTKAPIYKNPVSLKPVTVGRGDGGKDVISYDPESGAVNTPRDPAPVGRGGPAAPALGGKMTVEALRPVFKAQESDGDYTAVNATTGALGAYQVMPETGRALAARVGVAWRPDLMTSNTEAAIKYQDAIGGAAIQEAIEAGGGNPEEVFAYYYGGPDKSIHGPKTRKYVDDMMGRISGGAPAAATGQRGPVYSTPGKPVKPDAGYRLMTPDEKTEAGLDPKVPYQVSPKGKIEKIVTPSTGGAKQKLAVSAEEYEVRRSDTMAGARDTISAVDAILQHPSFEAATGPLQGRLPSLRAGTADFDLKVEAIRDKVVLNTITKLKSLSATGATGFGNLTEKEGKRLENAMGNLSQLSGPNLRTTLTNIKRDSMVIFGYAAMKGKASPDSVRMLVKNPKLAAQFDKAYGPGSAKLVLGR